MSDYDDGNITIEGKVLAVIKTPEPPLEKRYQATVRAATDHKLTQVENIVIATAKLDKSTVIDVLSIYLGKRTNRMEVRGIFNAYIFGKKPDIVKTGSTKWTVAYTDTKGQFIETYTITFIEL